MTATHRTGETLGFYSVRDNTTIYQHAHSNGIWHNAMFKMGTLRVHGIIKLSSSLGTSRLRCLGHQEFITLTLLVLVQYKLSLVSRLNCTSVNLCFHSHKVADKRCSVRKSKLFSCLWLVHNVGFAWFISLIWILRPSLVRFISIPLSLTFIKRSHYRSSHRFSFLFKTLFVNNTLMNE